MDWLRWHHGTVTDPKWRVVSRRASVTLRDTLSVWAAMLECASLAAERGVLEGWNHEDVAAAFDMDPEQVEAIYQAMQGKVLDGDRVVSWEKRQPKREDSTAAERKRAQRERQRDAASSQTTSRDVTQCHEMSRLDKIREEKIREESPPKPPHDDRADPTEQGQGQDDRKAMAREIIGEFDDMIAEVWSPQHRRAYPHPTDLQFALDWIDAGATPAICRQAFREANVRMAEDGKDPPRMLKARDRDVRQAITQNPGVSAATLRDLTLSDGRMAFGTAINHFTRTDQAKREELATIGRDPALTDVEKSRRAKTMLAEAGHPL